MAETEVTVTTSFANEKDSYTTTCLDEANTTTKTTEARSVEEGAATTVDSTSLTTTSNNNNNNNEARVEEQQQATTTIEEGETTTSNNNNNNNNEEDTTITDEALRKHHETFKLPATISKPHLSKLTRVKKLFLVYNLHSGKHLAQTIVNNIKPIFKEASIEVEYKQTEYAGHARELANKIDLDQYDGFCCVGGDGTIHEVLNGMLSREDKKQIPLGLIPGGTGNAFLTDLECANDPAEAARRICRGRVHPIDAGVVHFGDKTSRYFFNIVHYGFAVDVNVRAEKWRALKAQRYNVATLWELIRGRYCRYAELEIDGNKYTAATTSNNNNNNANNNNNNTNNNAFSFIMCHNTINTGKEMRIAPRSLLDDGKLDLIVMRQASRMTVLNLFQSIFDGSHLKSPHVEYFQFSDKLVIRPIPDPTIIAPQNTTPMPSKHDLLNVDGENTGITPIEVKVLPRAFNVFV